MNVLPIARVFKRFKNGSEDDLLSLFVWLRSQFAPAGVPGEAESFFRQAERFATRGEDHAGSSRAPRFYDYAVKLDPSLANRPRTTPSAKN